MSVDWTKPIQTRSGVRVRLVGAVNYGGARETRVVVRIGKDGKDLGRLWECYESGRQLGENDIFNVPPRKVTREVEAWAVVDGSGATIAVFRENPAPAGPRVIRLIGTVEVEVEE